MHASQREIGNYIFEDIYKATEKNKNVTAISFKGINYSFVELEQSVNYFAKVLIDKGVKPDDHVGLISLNSFNWLVAFYAIIKVGAVAVLLNYMNRYQNLVDAITRADCTYLVHGNFFAATKDQSAFYRLIKECNISEEW